MTNTMIDKVNRLLEQRRVLMIVGSDRALVIGDSGVWEVTATPDGLYCTCPAGRRCSHALAASVAWEENLNA